MGAPSRLRPFRVPQYSLQKADSCIGENTHRNLLSGAQHETGVESTKEQWGFHRRPLPSQASALQPPLVPALNPVIRRGGSPDVCPGLGEPSALVIAWATVRGILPSAPFPFGLEVLM